MKKLLALVLALVMTLGLATVSTSAAYSDKADIDYTEAADVMTAVGVFQGKGDAFAPKDNLNRAEAAKLVAYLMLGNKTAEAMTGSGTRFTDVPASHWAAGFIEYLASVGIVSGVGGGQFNPNGQVTAVQFAKMLLVALGYDAELENFVGDGWSINIQKVANKNDLFDGLDISANDALTREQAAQMCLNDLKADMVKYADKGTTVKIGESTVVTGAKEAAKDDDPGNKNYNDSKDDNGDKKYLQLAEERYGNDLKLKEASDSFGRPTNTWTYKNIKVGDYANKSDLLQTYTAKFSKKSLYDLLGKDQYDNIKDGKTTLNLWNDGVKTTYNKATDISTVMDRDDTTALNKTGNGTLTEVYLDDDNDVVNVVSVHTWVFQAASSYNATSGEISLKTVGTDDAATIGSDVSQEWNGKITLDKTVLKDDDFEEIKDLKKDDYVLVTGYHKNNADTTSNLVVDGIAKAEIMTGTVSSYTKADTVTIDGTTYKYDKRAISNDSHKKTDFTVGQQASLVMDKYGYIIAVDEAVVNNNYVFIANIASISGLSTNPEADAYFTDGTHDTLKINKLNNKDGASYILGARVDADGVGAFGKVKSGENAGKVSDNLGWYTWSKASNDKYNLSPLGTGYAQAFYTYAPDANDTDVVNGGKVAFLTSKAAGTVSKKTLTWVKGDLNANSLKANDKTVFVVEQDGDVDVYNGVKNIPTITLDNGEKASVVVAYKTSGDDKNFAKYVYITIPDTADVDGGQNTELFYILKKDTDNVIDDQKDYAMWYVINSEGKAELVKTDASFKADSYRGYYKTFKNSDNEYSKVTPLTSTDYLLSGSGTPSAHYWEFIGANKTGNEPIEYNNGSLTIAGQSFSVNGDTKIILVQAKTLAKALMVNPDANYEIKAMDGDELVNKFVNCKSYSYDVQARIGGDWAKGDRDLKEIYVTLRSVDATQKFTAAKLSDDTTVPTGATWIYSGDLNTSGHKLTIEEGAKVYVTGNFTVGNTTGDDVKIAAKGELEVGGTAEVKDNGKLTNNGKTVVAKETTIGGHVENHGEMTLNGTNQPAGVIVTGSNSLVLGKGSTATIYALTVAGTGKLVVNGELDVTGDLDIKSGANVTIAKGGDVNVTGVASIAEALQAGSTEGSLSAAGGILAADASVAASLPKDAKENVDTDLYAAVTSAKKNVKDEQDKALADAVVKANQELTAAVNAAAKSANTDIEAAKTSGAAAASGVAGVKAILAITVKAYTDKLDADYDTLIKANNSIKTSIQTAYDAQTLNIKAAADSSKLAALYTAAKAALDKVVTDAKTANTTLVNAVKSALNSQTLNAGALTAKPTKADIDAAIAKLLEDANVKDKDNATVTYDVPTEYTDFAKSGVTLTISAGVKTENDTYAEDTATVTIQYSDASAAAVSALTSVKNKVKGDQLITKEEGVFTSQAAPTKAEIEAFLKAEVKELKLANNIKVELNFTAPQKQAYTGDGTTASPKTANDVTISISVQAGTVEKTDSVTANFKYVEADTDALANAKKAIEEESIASATVATANATNSGLLEELAKNDLKTVLGGLDGITYAATTSDGSVSTGSNVELSITLTYTATSKTTTATVTVASLTVS